MSAVRTAFQRPDFPLEQRVRDVATVLARPGYGQVVDLARRRGISRQYASTLVHQGDRALHSALQPRTPGRPPISRQIRFDRERIEDAVLALTVDARASIAGIQACMQRIADLHLSTGRVSGIRRQASEQTAERLRTLPMPAVPVHALTDELYDHGQPVLLLMESEHLALLHAAQEPEADATTWGVHCLDLQARGLQVASLVSDQGPGMICGVVEANLLADQALQADVFHVERDLSRYVQTLRHQARRAQRHAEALSRALDYQTQPQHRRGHPPRPTTLEAYEQAQQSAATAAQHLADADFLLQQVIDSLQPADAEGRLIPEHAARQEIATAAQLLRGIGPTGVSLATLLERGQQHLHTFRAALAARHHDLCQRYGAPLVQFVAWAWRHRQALHEQLPADQATLEQRWSLSAPLDAVRAIWDTCQNCHRSSSALEGFNTKLRSHVRAHRGLGRLLPLIIFQHNVRPFPRGVHRGQAPFVALGLLPPDPRHWTEQLRNPLPVHQPAIQNPTTGPAAPQSAPDVAA